MPKSSSSSSKRLLLLYDGHCALCNGAVNWIIKRDKRQLFEFAPLSGPTADAIYSEYPELNGIDSIVLIEGNSVYTKSSAALRISHWIGGLWSAMQIYYIIPPFIRNAVYDGIASIRYRTFGKYDTCPVPPPEWRHRFKA